MALKPRMANTPITDSEGWIEAELSDVTYLEADESEYEREQYLFDFLAQGSQRPINFKIWTGTSLNADRYQNGNGSKTAELNKLTRLCISLGLSNEKQLKEAQSKGQEVDIDLEALKGSKVRFKLQKSAKNRGLSQIDIDTVKLVKVSEKANK